MTASDGWIRIKGQNIVLDADNEIFLQGKKVTIGNAENNSQNSTQIFGHKIVGSTVIMYKHTEVLRK